MRTTARSDPKCEVLRVTATLNPHPEQVTDPLFQIHPFFDARDLVQVRYEMVRRVLLEGQTVQTTAAAFGVSRVTWYHLRRRFEGAGLAGLLPQPKGPQRAHKLSDDVVAFILHLLETEPALRLAELPARVEKEFGRSVHLRSIERALAREQKKDRASGRRRPRLFPPRWSQGPTRSVATNPCAVRLWRPRQPSAVGVWS